jgi:hypothetical protein
MAALLVLLLSVTTYGLKDSLKECFLEKFTLTDKEGTSSCSLIPF